MNKILATCACGNNKYTGARSYNDSIKKYGSYTCLTCVIRKRAHLNGIGIREKQRREAGILNADMISVKCVDCDQVVNIQYQTLKQ